MVFIIELSVIIAYLYKDTLGMLISAIVYTYIFLKKGNKFIEKILCALIFSVPTFNIGFMGQKMHHMFSWCSIFVILLTIYLMYNYLSNKVKISKKSLSAILVILGIIFINCFREVNVKNAIIEWLQICLMLIPIIFVYDQRKYLYKMLSQDSEEKFVNLINYTVVATAIGVVMQYILYRKLGIRLGNITFYPGRTVYDLLISGASVLSVYLSVGVAINVKKIYDKFNIINLLYAIICVIGIAVNSARAGLVAAIIIVIIIAIPKIIKTKRNLLMSLILIPILAIAFINMTDTMLASRSTRSLFEANGRIGTYKYGFEVLTNGPKHFFLGAGLSLDNYNQIIPHNFILETLVTTGILVSIPIFILLFKCLKYINNNENKYIIWVILIGSMFITNFQGNTFFTIYMIVLILETTLLKDREEDKINEKSRNFNN